MRKNSIKNTRINGEVQKELSTIIRNEIKDPRIHPMTSVMAVEVAPDLKTCRAYISVLGEKEAKEATIKGLNSAEGYIRRQLARNLNLRNTPEIRFILDESIEYGVNMSKLIDDVTKKDSNSHRQEIQADIQRTTCNVGTSHIWVPSVTNGAYGVDQSHSHPYPLRFLLFCARKRYGLENRNIFPEFLYATKSLLDI